MENIRRMDVFQEHFFRFKEHRNMSTSLLIFWTKTLKVLLDFFMYCLELGPLIVTEP